MAKFWRPLMILQIILLFLIVVILTMIIMFLFYVLFPSIDKENLSKIDALVSTSEIDNELIDNDDTLITQEKAFVFCNSVKDFSKDKLVFNNYHTCSMVNSVFGSGTDCKYACIGLGDCAKVCPQQAIYFENNTAKISSLCIGCGNCIDVCPLKIIKLIPKDTKSCVICSHCAEKDLTSCSCIQKEEKVVWNDKKDFKIWEYCYKIANRLKNIKN